MHSRISLVNVGVSKFLQCAMSFFEIFVTRAISTEYSGGTCLCQQTHECDSAKHKALVCAVGSLVGAARHFILYSLLLATNTHLSVRKCCLLGEMMVMIYIMRHARKGRSEWTYLRGPNVHSQSFVYKTFTLGCKVDFFKVAT